MNKICLGIIATNEEDMLNRFLPGMSNAFAKNVVAIDYDSTDKTAEILEKYCKETIKLPWPRDFSIAKNNLINLAQESGYDWIFLLDADETLKYDSIKTLQTYVNSYPYDLYYLPRLGMYEIDVYESDPSVFPDLQARLFRLNSGFSYMHSTHTQLCLNGSNVFENHIGSVIPDIFLYHYANLKGSKAALLRIVERMGISQGWPKINNIDAETEEWFKNLRIKPIKLI